MKRKRKRSIRKKGERILKRNPSGGYYIISQGYDPPYPHFKTKAEAKKWLGQEIRADRKRSRNSLTLIKSIGAFGGEFWTLKIGGRQGYHTYSTYTLKKL